MTSIDGFCYFIESSALLAVHGVIRINLPKALVHMVYN